MVKWMTDELGSGALMPRSAIGKAILYSLERWDKLSAYLHHGSLEIDNNLVENVIRPLARAGRTICLQALMTLQGERQSPIHSLRCVKRKAWILAPGLPGYWEK